ncbi:hypothetical protein [[Eubacterium] cellulosolvens]
MPSWRAHVITGSIIIVALVIVCYYLELSYLFVDQNQVQYFFCFHIAFVSILGSLLPDFDYRKTRIRHMVGPTLVGFLLVSFLYLNRYSLFTIDPVSLLVLFIILILILFLLGLVIPFKHHGRMHSVAAAVIYTITWLILELFIFDMTPLQAGVIGLFGFAGYFSHLALDLDVKWL